MKKLRSDDVVKFLKKKHNIVPVVIIIIGIILMLTAGGSGKKKEETLSAADAAKEEARLEEILSKIDGAGKVRVMITYYGTAQQAVAYEVSSDTSGESSRTEKRAVMSGSSPMVVQELSPKVRGVIIAAQGADDPSVKRALAEAAAAAMGVGISGVKVYKSSF